MIQLTKTEKTYSRRDFPTRVKLSNHLEVVIYINPKLWASKVINQKTLVLEEGK